MVHLPEVIETAYVAIRPDTRGFAAETRQQVKRSLPAGKGRDIVPPIGIRGTAIKGLVGVGSALTGVTAGAVALTLAVRAGYNEFTEAQKVFAQVEQTIKSTGGVASVTAKEAVDLANSLNSISGIDDEVILQGENLLLTFKNVRNVVGEGNDIFDRATKAALDLSVKGFGSVNATSKQMGKALNDPIKGMTALGRAGVTFSAAQKEAIKKMVENNNVMGAQKAILEEVESQVGGSAEAYGQTLPAALGRLSNSFSELIAGGIGAVAPALTGAANNVSDFFDQLKDGGGAGATLRGTLDAVMAGITPLIDAIKSEGPRIRDIITTWFDAFRKSLPILKLVAVAIGITIVAAFKIGIRVMQLTVKVIAAVNTIFREAVKVIVSAVEKILGAFSGLARAASHIPFIGDKFDGVADAIDTVRESVRAFSAELDAVDGKQVNVTLAVSGPGGPGAAAGNVPGSQDATKPDAGLASKKGGVEPPGPRQQQETVLQNTLALARSTEATLADDRAALSNLIAFYTESVRLAKARGVGTRVYEAAINDARNEIAQINRDATQAAQDAADETKRAADEKRQAVLDEQRATLEANVRIATLTKATVRDDKIAYAKLISFLKERVAAARIAGAGIAAAVAELRAARDAIRNILRDAAQQRIDEREQLLEGAVQLASFTERKSDDDRALRKLIAYYKKRVKDENLSRVERQKYQIALARTKKDLRDLRSEQEDAAKEGDNFGRQSFEFLQNLRGFASNLAGNTLPKGFSAGLTESVVQAKSAAIAAATSASAPVSGIERQLGESGRDDLAQKGKSPAAQAAENREKAQGPATAAQFERLLSLENQQLRILRRIAQDQDHPGAKFNRKQSQASTVVGVA